MTVDGPAPEATDPKLPLGTRRPPQLPLWARCAPPVGAPGRPPAFQSPRARWPWQTTFAAPGGLSSCNLPSCCLYTRPRRRRRSGVPARVTSCVWARAARQPVCSTVPAGVTGQRCEAPLLLLFIVAVAGSTRYNSIRACSLASALCPFLLRQGPLQAALTGHVQRRARAIERNARFDISPVMHVNLHGCGAGGCDRAVTRTRRPAAASAGCQHGSLGASILV